MLLHVLLILAGCSAALSELPTFEQFKQIHNKTYASAEEEATRRAIYHKTVQWISENQAKHPTARFGINHLADWSRAEYLSQGVSDGLIKGFESLKVAKPQARLGGPFFDWRQENKLTPVKDQGSCGSCYAFASIATIEAQYLIHQNRRLDLSEQEIVDCSAVGGYQNQGCNVGSPAEAFRYALNQGVTTENNYPYKDRFLQCPSDLFNNGNGKYYIRDYYTLGYRVNDGTIMDAIYNNGPVTIAVNIESNAFQNYRSGILRNINQNSQASNHIMVLVGYGTENGIDYWILRNSWGTGWGQGGYVYVERGWNNMGINNFVTYPSL